MMRGGSYNRLHNSGTTSAHSTSYFSNSGPSYYTPYSHSNNGNSNNANTNNNNGGSKLRYLQYFLMLLFLFFVILTIFYRSSAYAFTTIGETPLPTPGSTTATSTSSSRGSSSGRKLLKAATWNIAAINNNPFEYWITSQDPAYNALMSNVSQFIVSTPSSFDQPIATIFTEKMLNELLDLLQEAKLLTSTSTGASATATTDAAVGGTRGMGSNGGATTTTPTLASVDDVRNYFTSTYANKKIISEFIKDGIIGKKRLISMPDRVTNTINTADGQVALRPTVINCFDNADLKDLHNWWKEWKFFMFQKEIVTKKKASKSSSSSASSNSSSGTAGTSGTPAAATQPQPQTQKGKIFKMIQKIEKSKYPTITVEEEKMSIPLSILSLAIFDSILVHMMNYISTSSQGVINWQKMRSTMCNSLNHQKTSRVLQILDTTYANEDILFLQEVAGNFVSITKDRTTLSNLYDIYQSSLMDTERDQNSFILLKKGKFRDVTEVTSEVNTILTEQSNKLKMKVPVVAGDLIVLLAADAKDKNSKYILASFHGDTNGLATKPVVSAVYTYATSQQPASKLLFGMDANTYAKPESDQQGVTDFAQFYTSKKLNSCYGPNPNPYNFTTFHARTHLQPQLNKAISLEEKDKKGDKNPKDFIIFFDSDFKVLQTVKDNTGEKKYIENMVFPTLSFPSDHGITSTILEELPMTRK